MQGLVGHEFGQYKILEELGRGSMGVVYKGVQTNLDRQVAIKILAPNLTGDQELVERFLREARLAGKLNHPNIIHVYDHGQTNGIYFIAMEYVDGQTLRQMLGDRGRLSPESTLEIAIPACDALGYAHELGIIHRDVKPDNIMIDKRGFVKVADFGLAKGVSSLTLTTPGAFVGSPYYVSPEQLMGDSLDFRADIYSLGRVLYRMLAGRTPFQSEDLLSLIQKELNQPVPPLREFGLDIPADLEAIVMRAQAKNREERFSTAGDMLVALKRARANLEAATVQAQITARQNDRPGPTPTRASQGLASAPPAYGGVVETASSPAESSRQPSQALKTASATEAPGWLSRMFAALSYLGFFGVLCLLFGRGNKLVAIHSRQAVTLHIFRLAIVSVVLLASDALSPMDVFLLSTLGVTFQIVQDDPLVTAGSWLITGIFWLIALLGLWKGLSGVRWRMPVFGPFSEVYALKERQHPQHEPTLELTKEDEEEKREMALRQEERWRRYWETIEATKREHARLARLEEISTRVEEILRRGEQLNDRYTIGEVDKERFDEARNLFEVELTVLKEEARQMGLNLSSKRLNWIRDRRPAG